MRAAMNVIQRLQTLASDSRRCTDMAQFGPFPSFKPATEALVKDCEKQLGFELPDFLRELFLKVGNGGFGPGYGLLGISRTGAKDDLGRDLVAAYREFKRTWPGFAGCDWPDRLLPFCYYGCAVYFCVDCAARSPAVMRFDASDMDESNPLATSLTKKSKSIEAWLRDWIRLKVDPRSPQPSKARQTKMKAARSVTRVAAGKKSKARK